MARKRPQGGPPPPGLFDELDDDPPVASSSPTSPAADEMPANPWREVPQDRFNSWSLIEQLRYCKARDENAALYTPSEEDAMWHAGRAKMYEEMIQDAKTSQQ